MKTVMLANWWLGQRTPEPTSPRPTTGGFAVLVTWPDGSHDLECLVDDRSPEENERRAKRSARRLRKWWHNPGPRPARFDVVPVANWQWEFHRHVRPCRTPECTLRGGCR